MMKNHLAGRYLIVIASVLLFFFGVGITGLAYFLLRDPARFGELPFTVRPLWLMVSMAAGVLLCVLGIAVMYVAFRRRKTTGFVRNGTVGCELDISLDTVDQHLRSCMETSYRQIGLLNHSVYAMRNGVGIQLQIDLPVGTDIPTIVSNMKEEACDFITSCTGLEVCEFLVQVSGTQRMPLLPPTEEERQLQHEDMLSHILFSEESEPEPSENKPESNSLNFESSECIPEADQSPEQEQPAEQPDEQSEELSGEQPLENDSIPEEN